MDTTKNNTIVTDKIFTKFSDMHSGGTVKERWEKIYIEAPYDEAITIFKNRFNRDPFYAFCECCGANYAVTEYTTGLYQATSFDRNCKYNYKSKKFVETGVRHISLEDYLKRNDVLVIFKKDISPQDLF